MSNNQRRKRSSAFDSEDRILDDVNLAILAELQASPRLPIAKLGRRIGMSPPPPAERVQRLERAGIIAGYQLDIDPAAVGLQVTAFARIRPMPGSLPKIAPTIGHLEAVLDRFLAYGNTTTSIVVSTPRTRAPAATPASQPAP